MAEGRELSRTTWRQSNQARGYTFAGACCVLREPPSSCRPRRQAKAACSEPPWLYRAVFLGLCYQCDKYSGSRARIIPAAPRGPKSAMPGRSAPQKMRRSRLRPGFSCRSTLSSAPRVPRSHSRRARSGVPMSHCSADNRGEALAPGVSPARPPRAPSTPRRSCCRQLLDPAPGAVGGLAPRSCCTNEMVRTRRLPAARPWPLGLPLAGSSAQRSRPAPGTKPRRRSHHPPASRRRGRPAPAQEEVISALSRDISKEDRRGGTLHPIRPRRLGPNLIGASPG